VLKEGELAMTAEFKLDFVRPALFAPLFGTGAVRQKGGRVAFLEARLVSAKDELLVAASSTWTVVRNG
jgi:acyl-coenzyme A thioesterase PaaI-like protein